MIRNLSLLLAIFAAFPVMASDVLKKTDRSVIESNPKTDLDAYLVAGQMPRYIRINVAGYNVRSSTDFTSAKTDNIDFTTGRGAMFAVRNMTKLENGVAVNIFVDGQDRWVYVPNWRRHDFQFCESESCFSDLALVLNFLQEQKITPENLTECGFSLDAQGSLVEKGNGAQSPALGSSRTNEELKALNANIPAGRQPRGAPPVLQANLRNRQAPVPARNPRASGVHPASDDRPQPAADTQPSRAPRTSIFTPHVKPLWEMARADGKDWTKMLVDSLRKYGQNLKTSNNIGNAQKWCPNYAALTPSQRLEFYTNLFPGFGRYESDFKTTLVFDESTLTNPRHGRIKKDSYSMGLFQLSYGSADMPAYKPFCHFDWQRDKNKDISDPTLTIYDVKKQMDCAVGILNYWAKKDGVVIGDAVKVRNRHGKIVSIHPGGARFWSTLRSTSTKSRLVANSLKRFTPCWSK